STVRFACATSAEPASHCAATSLTSATPLIRRAQFLLRGGECSRGHSTPATACTEETIAPRPACWLKNLAGFTPRFRFIGQKHICAVAKKEPSHGVKAQKPKPKENIYETQPEQTRGRFALRICGHHLFAHYVGNYPRARRCGGCWQNASNRRTSHS